MPKEKQHWLSRISMVLGYLKSGFISTYKDKQAWEIALKYFMFIVSIMGISFGALSFYKFAGQQINMSIPDELMAMFLSVGVVMCFLYIILQPMLWLRVVARDDKDYKYLKASQLLNIIMHNLDKLVLFYAINILFVIFSMIPIIGVIVNWIWFFATIISVPLILSGNDIKASIKKSWDFLKNNIIEIATIIIAMGLLFFIFVFTVVFVVNFFVINGMNYGDNGLAFSILGIIKTMSLIIFVGLYVGFLTLLPMVFYSVLFRIYNSFYQEKSDIFLKPVHGKSKQKMYYIFISSLALYLALILFIFVKQMF